MITNSEPPVWTFYDPTDSTYLRGRPVAYWTDAAGVEWIKAHSSVSPSTGRQYELLSKWSEKHNEWVLVERSVIN